MKIGVYMVRESSGKYIFQGPAGDGCGQIMTLKKLQEQLDKHEIKLNLAIDEKWSFHYPGIVTRNSAGCSSRF